MFLEVGFVVWKLNLYLGISIVLPLELVGKVVLYEWNLPSPSLNLDCVHHCDSVVPRLGWR